MHDVTAALADPHRELAETSDGVTPYLPRFLDSYEDHSLMGIAAKKEASELSTRFKRWWLWAERKPTTSSPQEGNENRP